MMHDTQKTLAEVAEKLEFMTSMYLTGGVNIAPTNPNTIFDSFRQVRLALDRLESFTKDYPAGK